VHVAPPCGCTACRRGGSRTTPAGIIVGYPNKMNLPFIFIINNQEYIS
jgi:hypothetical protein